MTFIRSRSQDYTRHKQNKTKQNRKKKEKTQELHVCPDLLPSEAWAPETTARRSHHQTWAFISDTQNHKPKSTLFFVKITNLQCFVI